MLRGVAKRFHRRRLAHAPALAAVGSPMVNSYKRLTVAPRSGHDLGAWPASRTGRTTHRAPVRTLPGRFEWRNAGRECESYLATAALVAAGLGGVDRRLGPAVTDDSKFVMPPAEQRAASPAAAVARGAGRWRSTPRCAVRSVTRWPPSSLRLKRAEWTGYARHVGPWELDRHAARF